METIDCRPFTYLIGWKQLDRWYYRIELIISAQWEEDDYVTFNSRAYKVWKSTVGDYDA